MKIENQNIYGGNQQFADTIINQNSQFSNEDSALLKAIFDFAGNDIKTELVEGLKILKAPESSENEKQKSGALIKKFFESGVGEAGKIVFKEVLLGLTKASWKWLPYIT